jgi:hypothetical protein
MLLFVLDPYRQPTLPPSIYVPEVETLSRQTTSGPRVHGEVDKHRPEPTRPSIIPIPKFDTYAEPRVESHSYQSRLACGAALCGAEALNLYPISTSDALM